MREIILEKLCELSKQERTNVTSNDKDTEQKFYSRPGRFIIDRRRIADISAGDPTLSVEARTHPSGSFFPEHSHNFIELMYVYRGSITHIISGERITLKSGEIIMLGRNTSHSIDVTSQNEIGVNLIVSCDLLELLLSDMRNASSLSTYEIQKLLEMSETGYLVFKTSEDERIANLMDNIVSAYILPGGINEYVQRQSFTLLISYLALYNTNPDSHLSNDLKNRLLNYVKTSYSTATLTEAAEIFGLSVPYLSRWIVKNIGTSFKEILMQERFSAARELLLTTKMSIGDIIRSVGYENNSYFHKEFKKRFTTTPNQYRKKNLNRL